MTFRVGMKVVCIVGALREEPPPQAIKGHVYTISSIEAGCYSGQPCLCFEELNSSPLETETAFWDQGFIPEHFRPVIERKTDTGMAILRKLLDGNKIEEKV